MKITLVRFAYTEAATLGYLFVGDRRLATLEEPWIANPHGPGGQVGGAMKAASCIPDGDYELRPHSGAKMRNVWAMVNPKLGVWYMPDEIPAGQKWGRFATLFHIGNSLADIEGCAAVGLRHGHRASEPMVYESAAAIDLMRQILGTTERHALTIRPTLGTSETL